MNENNLQKILDFLNKHHRFFFESKKYADQTAQPTPEDSRAWSQILISLLTEVNGLGRQKGPDLLDGSDVKAANTWGAIDTPRFNGCIKSGTLSSVSDSMDSLNQMPHLYFVLWDNAPDNGTERTRIWAVNTQTDPLFREMCELWYQKRQNGEIKSTNFQLHPPRNKNSNVFTNTCGNLNYPLVLDARWNGETYKIIHFDEKAIENGFCTCVE